MSDKKFICGIDYSMSCPAVCVFHGNQWSFKHCQIYYTIATKKFLVQKHKNIFPVPMVNYTDKPDQFRYDWLSQRVIEWSSGYDKTTPHYFLEGYSYGSKGMIANIAENGSILKHKLWSNGHSINIIAPTTVKRFAVGKGNAKKTPLYEQFYKETKVNLVKLFDGNPESSPISDIVDSYFICKYGFETISNINNLQI